MKKLALILFVLFAVLLGTVTRVQAQAKKAPAKPVKVPPDKLLNNKVYIVTIEPPKTGKKKPKPMEDEISFKTTKLFSLHFQEEHFFKPTFYTVSVDTTFEEPEEAEESDEETPAAAPAPAVVDSTKVATAAPAVPAKKLVKVINFESIQKNDLEDELTWTGQIVGDSISGSAIYKVKKQKADMEYIFYGHMKPKPGKKKPAAK